MTENALSVSPPERADDLHHLEIAAMKSWLPNTV